MTSSQACPIHPNKTKSATPPEMLVVAVLAISLRSGKRRGLFYQIPPESYRLRCSFIMPTKMPPEIFQTALFSYLRFLKDFQAA